MSPPPRPSPILTLLYAGRAAIGAAAAGKCIHCGDDVRIVRDPQTGREGKALVCGACVGLAVDKAVDVADDVAKRGASALVGVLFKRR